MRHGSLSGGLHYYKKDNFYIEVISTIFNTQDICLWNGGKADPPPLLFGKTHTHTHITEDLGCSLPMIAQGNSYFKKKNTKWLQIIKFFNHNKIRSLWE